jgi:hypothetical protein
MCCRCQYAHICIITRSDFVSFRRLLLHGTIDMCCYQAWGSENIQSYITNIAYIRSTADQLRRRQHLWQYIRSPDDTYFRAIHHIGLTHPYPIPSTSTKIRLHYKEIVKIALPLLYWLPIQKICTAVNLLSS